MRVHQWGRRREIVGMSSLEGKIAWITGAGSGIGRACAVAFAAAGARVALTGRRREALEESAALIGQPAQVLVVPADLTRDEEVLSAHRTIRSAFGNPNILLNNAGGNITRRHWKELAYEDASRVIDLDLKVPFACSLAVLPAMRERREGTLIHIASLAAVTFNTVSGASYTAAKLGILGMSDSINAEEGIHGIRSVCICPGEVETPILNTRPRPPTEAERALMAQPEDIAATALFCATLPARACVTRLVIEPTDNHWHRDAAHRIARRPEA
jgi:NADP-dependent 3-hydroxy acid dehydrogenase YdfG